MPGAKRSVKGKKTKKKHARTVQPKKRPFFPATGYRYPLPRRWLLRYLFAVDSLTTKRWAYWGSVWTRGKVFAPIPQINFESTPNKEAFKMLQTNIDYMTSRHGHRGMEVISRYFFPWILWGFGAQGIKRPKVPKDVSKFWYENLNLDLLLKHPHDYMPDLLLEYGYKATGYCSTPHDVSNLLTVITFGSGDKKQTAKSIQKSFHEPCSGTGIMTLEASNYTVNQSVVDISPLMTMLMTFNAYLYVPWLIYPLDKVKRIFTQNLLSDPILGRVKK